jgi:uncharacterized HAD superfamily protein
MKIKPKSIIAVDLDKTLCKEECFTEEECFYATPIKKTIDKINNLNRKGHFIIIHTSRKEDLRLITEYWLKKNKVSYNVLVCEKLWADYYIDDKNLKINDL